jgi:membrane-associated phospholipid phosphatase
VANVETQTAWDKQIPFCPQWVWLYLVPYLIGPVLAGCLSWATFTWYVRRGLVLVFVSLLIFMVYPTRTVRPPLASASEVGGLTADAYNRMVAVDEPPANAAPSLHVSLTCLLFWALVRDFPRWWPVALAGVAVVWLATLLTWQHHLIDVATGVLLGSVLALPWPRRRHYQ